MLNREFLKFAAVGALGFVVDALSLMFAREVLGINLYAGRVFSYLMAASFTWFCNRKYTFKSTDESLFAEWFRFLNANAIGGVVNYLVYAAAIKIVGGEGYFYIVAVGLGSLSGLIFNFTMSKRLVFRKKPG